MAVTHTRKDLFKNLRRAGKSPSYIAGQLKSKFWAGATSIARIFKSGGISASSTIKTLRKKMSTSTNSAANIVKNVFNI